MAERRSRLELPGMTKENDDKPKPKPQSRDPMTSQDSNQRTPIYNSSMLSSHQLMQHSTWRSYIHHRWKYALNKSEWAQEVNLGDIPSKRRTRYGRCTTTPYNMYNMMLRAQQTKI